MEPALHEGDGLIGWRRSQIRRGEIRAFEHPARPGFWVVKRVDHVRGDRFEAVSDNPDAGAVDSRVFGDVPIAGSYRVVAMIRGPGRSRSAGASVDGPTHVRGTITAVGFMSGDRFVIGNWPESPVGPIGDVMHIRPDGRRRLLVNDDASAEFITSIYEFDEVRVGPLRVEGDGRSTSVAGHGLELTASGGRLRPIPFPRPKWVTRYVEDPVARALLGVRTFGTSPTGVREWYQSRGWRWIERAEARLEGATLGDPTDVERPIGVGFTDPPVRPSIVSVRVAIHPPN